VNVPERNIEFVDAASNRLKRAGIQGQIFSQKLVLFGVVERYLNKPVPACPIKVEVATAVR
jgi:hypothetical protein